MKTQKTVGTLLRRILAVMCTIAMILPVLPILPASAANKTRNYNVKNAEQFVERMREGTDAGSSATISIKLTKDIDLLVTKDISSCLLLYRGSVILDLNGKTLTIRNDSSYTGDGIFELISSATMTVKGNGTIRFSPSSYNGKSISISLFKVSRNSSLRFENITVDGCNVDQSVSGGCVRLFHNILDGQDTSSFVMYGGTIQNFFAWNGGAVYIGGKDNVFELQNGGTIRNCVARQYGGAVFNNGTFRMDGTIDSCKADNLRTTVDEDTEEPVDITVGRNNVGGGVYTAGTFHFIAGSITNCSVSSSQGKGGGIYAATGSNTIIGESIFSPLISGNSARHGGGIFMWGGSMSVEKGSIQDNKAEVSGSQICLFETNKPTPVVFTMSGGSVSCTSSSGGNAKTAIHIDGSTNKFTIGGSATVSVYGKDYGIRSKLTENFMIDTTGGVTATGGTGAFECMPTVVNMQFQTGSLMFPTYISSPTSENYRDKWVCLSRASVYTASFMNGDTLHYAVQNLKNALLLAPLPPIKSGYDFIGWFTEDNQQAGTYITLTDNIVYYARFREKTVYNLEYVCGGSVPVQQIKYEENLLPDALITLPAAPTQTGHNFTGWFAGNVLVGYGGEQITVRSILESGGVTFNGTLRLVAAYTANEYTVTFQLGNGQPDMIKTVPYGDKIEVPTDPERAGYAFAGWENLPDTMPAGNITVTAKWTPKQFAVTVVNGSGSGNYTLGETVTIRADEAPDGMVFDKWIIVSGEASLQNASAAETTFTMPIGQVTIQATYKHVHRYTQENTDPQFLASSATCEHRATYYYSCSCGEKGSNTFEAGTLAEHTFSQNDWYVSDDAHWHECTVCSAELHRETHSDDDRNHACDICGKTVSVCSDDNRDHMCDTCGNRLTDHSGGTATCLEKAICSLCGEHYGEFSAHAYRTTWSNDHTGHWHECSVCGARQNESAHRYTDDLDADCEDCGYVRTVTRTFTVTFDPANGEPLFTVTLSAGAAIPVPADPVRDGYFFIGWKNLPSAMPENDIIVTAQWQRIGLQSILLDPTSDLTLGIPVFLPDVHAEVMLRVTLNGKTEEFTALSAENPSGRYFFLYENVTPRNLMDEISLELWVNGVCTDTLTTTTADICLQIVDERPELKQVVTDLFAYGAALQAYTGYKPEALVSLRALMDEKGLVASDRDVEPSTSKTVTAPMNEGAELKGIGLYFTNCTGLYIRFTAEDVSSVTVKVNGSLCDQKDFQARGNGEYVLYLPDVSLDELDDVNEVVLRAHGHKVQIIRYAISDYIAVTQYGKNTYSDGVKALTKALFNWKKSAEELHTAP